MAEIDFEKYGVTSKEEMLNRIFNIDSSGYRIRRVEYRLYPNITQEKLLENTLEMCRNLYNDMLHDCKYEAIEGSYHRSKYDMDVDVMKRVNENLELKDSVYCTCLRDVGRRVYEAMDRCFLRKDGSPEHLPRYKSCTRYRSFIYRTSQGYKFKGRKLHLSKIGDVKYRNRHHPRGGKAVSCTVFRDADNNWFACIVYRVPKVFKGTMDLYQGLQPEGYDLGLGNLVTDSIGNQVRNPDFYAERREEISKIQSKKEKYERGSPQWMKLSREIAAVHEQIKRKRRGFMHRLAFEMVREHCIIVFEKLAPKKMREKDNPASMNDRYTDASWGMLTRMVEYKAESAGIRVTFVNPKDTSRTCSTCGCKKDMPLSQRTYRCDNCGLVLDRDVNAARNILRRGLGVETIRKENGSSSKAGQHDIRNESLQEVLGSISP